MTAAANRRFRIVALIFGLLIPLALGGGVLAPASAATLASASSCWRAWSA
ncbi:hypothetical protein AB0F81_41060 [Actinoplanes sp. NPDC024001]